MSEQQKKKVDRLAQELLSKVDKENFPKWAGKAFIDFKNFQSSLGGLSYDELSMRMFFHHSYQILVESNFFSAEELKYLETIIIKISLLSSLTYKTYEDLQKRYKEFETSKKLADDILSELSKKY